MTSLITALLTFFCCILVFQPDFIAAQQNTNTSVCVTPNLVTGTCINIDQCPVLYKLVVPNITTVERELLKDSQCGYINTTVQVCCPTTFETEISVNSSLTTNQTATVISKETAQNNQNLECLTPNHATGVCINIDQCPVLQKLLVPTITTVETELLRSSQCGYFNKTVQVCCPTQSEITKSATLLSTTETVNNTACVTPNQESATCIELEQCQYLFNFIGANLTEDNKQFIKRSQCGYENKKILICCPDHQRVSVRSSSTNSTIQLQMKGVLPAPPHCGLALTNRIYGGTIAGIDEYPWLALIEYTKGANGKGFHCGGALINDRYVITAAHCTTGYSIPPNWKLTGVRLGEHDLATNPDCDVGVNGKPDCNPEFIDISVMEIVPHPHYNPNSRNKQHDIALLRLATVVPINNFIKPICLPSEADMRSNDFNGTAMDIAGWGKTEMLTNSNVKLKATVNVWRLEDCRNIYDNANISLERTHMCAGGVEGIDSCSGDSGGPLMVQLEATKFNVYFIAGIVSFGPVPCGRDGWPGVYTRVGSYISWIQDNVLP